MTRPAAGHGAPQGEALATWGLWLALLVIIAATYTRLDASELYNVSRDGISGALSRVLVEVNYPISLVAIALVLIALDALPGRWWAIGGPAIALCAVTAWPGVVDDADLDARPVNALPALGVALAAALTAVAVTRTGRGIAPRRPLDRARIAVAVVVALLSLPWLAADLGFYFPEGLFIAERPITGADGTVGPAVHLGHHHGLDGALLAVSALLLSRPRLRSLSAPTTLYVSLMFGYGAVNFGQDYWNEQLQKRDWVEWSIPSALRPGLTLVWLVVVIVTAATAAVLRYEAGLASPSRRDGRLGDGAGRAADR